MKAIIIESKFYFQSEFINKNKFNNTINVKNATDQQWYDWGFREYVIPEITFLQKLGGAYFNKNLDIFTLRILDKTQITEVEMTNQPFL